MTNFAYFITQLFHARWRMVDALFHGLMIGALILITGGISGCDKVSQLVQRIRYSATNAASTTSTASTTASTANATTQPANAKPKPVSYPFHQWQQTPINPIKVKDINAVNQFLTAQFGKKPNLPTVDTRSLDYSGNLATQYRYTLATAPYFEVIDSPKYIELGWYYASASDHVKEKQLAISYAANAYQLARAWLGNQAGATLVESMLAGDTINNQTINGMNIAIARCEAFSCMLVLKK